MATGQPAVVAPAAVPTPWKQKSFAELLSRPSAAAISLPITPLEVYKGEPNLVIPEDEHDVLITPWRFALVGKFHKHAPNLESLRKSFHKVGFKGNFSIGRMDSRHVLIRFDLEEDYCRFWRQGIWNFFGLSMRVFKWTYDFNVHEEPSIVPIWIGFEGLPIHLYNKSKLFSLAKAVGQPLALDAPTAAVSRPSIAKVCVEVDLLSELPHRIRITHAKTGKGFWQSIVYDDLPEYCLNCMRIGHHVSKCGKQIPLVKPPAIQRLVTTKPAEKDKVAPRQGHPQPAQRKVLASGLTVDFPKSVWVPTGGQSTDPCTSRSNPATVPVAKDKSVWVPTGGQSTDPSTSRSAPTTTPVAPVVEARMPIAAQPAPVPTLTVVSTQDLQVSQAVFGSAAKENGLPGVSKSSPLTVTSSIISTPNSSADRHLAELIIDAHIHALQSPSPSSNDAPITLEKERRLEVLDVSDASNDIATFPSTLRIMDDISIPPPRMQDRSLRNFGFSKDDISFPSDTIYDLSKNLALNEFERFHIDLDEFEIATRAKEQADEAKIIARKEVAALEIDLSSYGMFNEDLPEVEPTKDAAETFSSPKVPTTNKLVPSALSDNFSEYEYPEELVEEDDFIPVRSRKSKKNAKRTLIEHQMTTRYKPFKRP